MQKRTPAAQILSLQICEGEKLELLVTHMVRFAEINSPWIRNFCYKFNKHATGEQRTTFIKLHDMGWNLSKIVWDEAVGKIAFSVNTPDCAAWVGPDGKLERAANGKKTAYLAKNWKEV